MKLNTHIANAGKHLTFHVMAHVNHQTITRLHLHIMQSLLILEIANATRPLSSATPIN